MQTIIEVSTKDEQEPSAEYCEEFEGADPPLKRRASAPRDDAEHTHKRSKDRDAAEERNRTIVLFSRITPRSVHNPPPLRNRGNAWREECRYCHAR